MPSTAAITAAVGPLVGRRDEIRQIGELLEHERLVTVTGAGGSGKTRLALELVDRDPDAAVFVQLASLREPSLVAAAIAQELGLEGAGAEEALVEALATRRLLLCLDNFEHVVDAAPLVSRLLAAAPEVRFLVTSRTPLGLSGEQEFPLAPFGDAEAIEFFTVRARRVQPAFEADGAVAEICRRLDGLPLALELAAARVKMLSPAQILDRLQRGLPLLTAARRDVPERHRTLHAAIDWSYQLLAPDEQRLFARLSLFPGGCTLDAAIAVDEDGSDTLEHVASLIDKSLLRRQEAAAEPRFRMLETLREYAQERLEESGLADDLHARQAAYYVELAERSQLEMMEADGYARWVAALRDELDNLEAAVYWGFGRDPEAALRILGACGSRVFHLAPARVMAWLEEGLAFTSGVAPPVAAAVLRTAGFARLVVRDLARAEELLVRAIALREQLGDQAETARARALLATVYAHMGRADDARAAADRAVVEARASGDERTLVIVLPNIGSSMSAISDYERTIAALEEVIPLAERRGAWASLFVARINLGSVLLRHDPSRAGEVFRAALAQAASVPDTQVLHAREGVAMALLLTGAPEDARREFASYIEAARETGLRAHIEAAVAGLMAVAAATGDAAAAARLAGARRRIAPEIRLAPYLEPFADAARTELGDDEWQRLCDEGGELPLEELLAPVLAGSAGNVVSRAFVFTDIVSSTQLLQLIGDSAWSDLVSWHDRTLRALFAAHGGEEVDHAGDGFFVSFSAAREAIACAIAIQRALAEHRRTHGFAPEVRIGVHESEASPAPDGWRGLGVHTAARIAATAAGGEIVASEPTALAARAELLGDPSEVALKGLADPVAVTRIAWR